MLSETKVLKKLGISDFGHLTKNKVMKMVSLLDKMEPEVAKKAIEQFPEFTSTMRDIVEEYKQFNDKEIDYNNEVTEQTIDIYKNIIDGLLIELNKENLSFEQRKYIIEQLKELAINVDKKDSENKKFILGMTFLATLVTCGTAAILASVLGGSTELDIDDID